MAGRRGANPRDHPLADTPEAVRRRFGLRDELLLAALPTLTVLAVLALVQALTRQRLLFASLASSAFWIYLDPRHATNGVRTLVTAHLGAAGLGLVAYLGLGPGYAAGGLALVAAILGMVLLDAVHPPAVSTALAFALRRGDASNLGLFALAVALTAWLVVLERAALWLPARFR